MQPPRNRPVAWFPTSARWHVFSAALRLPRSRPLISPFGLPLAGYPTSARWHVLLRFRRKRLERHIQTLARGEFFLFGVKCEEMFSAQHQRG